MSGDDRRPTHERLAPGGHCRISEADWMTLLESCEVLHQWGPAFLVDEGEGGCVRAYLRDDSGTGRHTAFRLDAERSARARAGVLEIERAAARAADLVTRQQSGDDASLEAMREQDAASARFVERAEALYRELLALPRQGGADQSQS